MTHPKAKNKFNLKTWIPLLSPPETLLLWSPGILWPEQLMQPLGYSGYTLPRPYPFHLDCHLNDWVSTRVRIPIRREAAFILCDQFSSHKKIRVYSSGHKDGLCKRHTWGYWVEVWPLLHPIWEWRVWPQVHRWNMNCILFLDHHAERWGGFSLHHVVLRTEYFQSL